MTRSFDIYCRIQAEERRLSKKLSIIFAIDGCSVPYLAFYKCDWVALDDIRKMIFEENVYKIIEIDESYHGVSTVSIAEELNILKRAVWNHLGDSEYTKKHDA